MYEFCIYRGYEESFIQPENSSNFFPFAELKSHFPTIEMSFPNVEMSFHSA